MNEKPGIWTSWRDALSACLVVCVFGAAVLAVMLGLGYVIVSWVL